jgi:hypothetical protein
MAKDERKPAAGGQAPERAADVRAPEQPPERAETRPDMQPPSESASVPQGVFVQVDARETLATALDKVIEIADRACRSAPSEAIQVVRAKLHNARTWLKKT